MWGKVEISLVGKTGVGVKSRREEGGGAVNPLNAELNPICHLLALLGAHHILHVSRIRVRNLGSPSSTAAILH